MTQYKLNTPIKSFNTYVFDCDGVLLDSNRVKTEAFYHAALPYGEPAAQAFIDYHKANGGISRQKKFEYFFLNILNLSALPEDKYQKALNDYGKLTAEGLVRCEVLPGVLEFLTSLPAQAKKFVVSGGAQDEVRWVLEAKGLATFFDGIYGNPVDKLTLVKNLDLKDSDYPGIFFGDARYDHEVAKANGLDFIFLSAVSDFDGWEEYVESHSLPAFESFTSLSIAAQVAEQKALIEKEQIESESPPEVVEKKRKALFFGFPWSPKRASMYAGSTTGPIVVTELVKFIDAKAILISTSAGYYRREQNVTPIYQKIANWDTAAKSCEDISASDLDKYSSFLPTVLEMLERNPVARKITTAVPHYQVGGALRKLAINKISFWNKIILSGEIDFYINSNVPHLNDDYICYNICRILGIPTAFPYRLPIVPGVMSRLYIPESIYNHDQVYNREGELINYSRDSLYKGDLPKDLKKIYDNVVLGDYTLSSLSKEVLISRGDAPPQQWTPPLRALSFADNVKKNVMKKLNFDEFLLSVSSRRIALSNIRSYKKLSTKENIINKPYIYYALHMQPEASSSPLGGGFADQLRAIRFLASKLPRGWQLIVKEHPHQKMEERPKDLYSSILASPNIKLASMEFSSDELQANAVAVATLTGTAALEAWLKGRPAIVLGNILFQSAPGIYKVRTDEDLLKAYEMIKNGEIHTVEDIRHYFHFLAEASFPGDLDAYINPCMPSYDMSSDESEVEIAYRLAVAISSQSPNIELTL